MDAERKETMANIRQAAGYLDYSHQYLANLRCYGGGPPYIRKKNRIWYPLSGLRAFAVAKGIETNEGALQI